MILAVIFKGVLDTGDRDRHKIMDDVINSFRFFRRNFRRDRVRFFCRDDSFGHFGFSSGFFGSGLRIFRFFAIPGFFCQFRIAVFLTIRVISGPAVFSGKIFFLEIFTLKVFFVFKVFIEFFFIKIFFIKFVFEFIGIKHRILSRYRISGNFRLCFFISFLICGMMDRHRGRLRRPAVLFRADCTKNRRCCQEQ